jgi:spermidine/putrescine transport system substrate-binding protein
MAFHPRDRSPWNRSVNRRDMLRLSAGTVLAGSVLAACGESGRESGGGTGGIVIGSPSDPVKQPLFDDNQAIESGLEPEDGPLKLYNWADYIWKPVLDDFSKKYDVDVELTTFYNLEEAIRKLSTGKVTFDVFFPTAENIPKLVAAKLLQPLNRDYIPSLEKNVWPRLVNPYYDVGSRYTVPYVLYHTGIGWRVDMVKTDINAMGNPWDVFWDPAHNDITGLYDDYRETVGVGLYRNDILDINTGDPAKIAQAEESLIELVDLVNVRYTIDGAYSRLPEGKMGLHHAWSGDMVNARYYAPKGEDPSLMRYLWPPKGSNSTTGGYVSNDALAILKDAEHPVLAHLFLEYLMQEKPSLKNFGWLGYQPPQNSLDVDTLVEDGWVPEYLASAVVSEEDFGMGQAPIQLTPEADRRWLEAWSNIKAGG